MKNLIKTLPRINADARGSERLPKAPELPGLKSTPLKRGGMEEAEEKILCRFVRDIPV